MTLLSRLHRPPYPPQSPQGEWIRTTRPMSQVMILMPHHMKARPQMSHQMSWSPLIAQMPRMVRMNCPPLTAQIPRIA